jgi:hypothetical protein
MEMATNPHPYIMNKELNKNFCWNAVTVVVTEFF